MKTIFYRVYLYYVDHLACLLMQSNYYVHQLQQQITDCHLYEVDF